MTVLNYGFNRQMERLRNMHLFTVFLLTHPSGSPPLQFFHSFKNYFLSTPVVVYWVSTPTKCS